MFRVWNAIRANPYGWVIVVIAALAMVGTLPGRTHGMGMITERIVVDPLLGLNRVSYADMNLWATLLGGLFCLPCGYLIDRFGLRATLVVTVVALGAVVIGMTKISGWWPLFILVTLTRGFGQSALSIISIAMVGKWFSGRQSMAMAVYSLILSLGFGMAAQWAKPYMDDDWRVLWGGMGWILLLGLAPLALLFTRDPRRGPADAAKSGSGKTLLNINPLGAERGHDDPNVGFTLSQAMQTPAFWVFGLSISLIALIGSGQSLFNESVLKQQGFSKEVYYNLITLTIMIGLAVKIPVGWLGLHMSLNHLNAAGLLILAGSLFWLPYIRTNEQIVIYAVLCGVSGTITTVLFFTIWGQAYGRAHLGTIQSVAQMMTVLASALGPKVYAECFTRYKSYAPAFQVLAAMVAILGAWSLVIRVPAPREAASIANTPQPLQASYSESST